MLNERFTVALCCLAIAACTQQGAEQTSTAPAVTIMTFNVENLFDNVDDPDRDDHTYLPLAAKQDEAHAARCSAIEVERWRNECLELDWSDDVIETKLRNVAGAIRQVDGGPDVIALQEIENAAILARLVREHLDDLGYGKPILIEGQDLRGIDVAFLSRLPMIGEARLHALGFDEFPEREADTRGVLEATFELPDGGLLTGFAVHFPAPFHPTEMRVAAYEQLNALRDAVPGDRHVFAAGDFNTTSTEAAETGLLDDQLGSRWQIAHRVALADDCEHCRGTQYYARDDSWSFLDMILWSPPRGENATWGIRANSVRVANEYAEQRRDDGTPRRFAPETGRGVSDHWPLVMTIEPTGKQ